MTGQPPVGTLLFETDWSRLSHAYGPAADTPDQLLKLVSDDPGERAHAVHYLWETILHQGSLCPATPAVAGFVAALLPHRLLAIPVSSMLGDQEYPPGSVRAGLLHFLGEVAEAADDHRADLPTAAQCRALAPKLLTAVLPWIGDIDPDVHDAATFASVHLATLLAHRQTTAALASRLQTMAGDAAVQPRHRGTCVLGLNALGTDSRSYLDDDCHLVRICAFLGQRSMHGEERLLGDVIAMLDALPESDQWLGHSNPWLRGRLRNLLIAAVGRASTFGCIGSVAASIARAANHDTDLEPLLEVAFPAWAGPLPAIDPDRRALLQALADNDEAWHSGFFPDLGQALLERGLPSTPTALDVFLSTVLDGTEINGSSRASPTPHS